MQSDLPPRTFILPSKDIVSAAQLYVLVVQKDDPLWLCETLHLFGFSEQAVRHGGTALDWLAQMKGITGVLVDVCARTADDRSLVSELHHRHPQLPIMTMAARRTVHHYRRGAVDYCAVVGETDSARSALTEVSVREIRPESPRVLDRSGGLGGR